MNNVNITVLKDESLGGVMREYNEVKRKARVGEYIKIVAASQPQYPIGAIGKCTRDDEFSDGSIDTTLSFQGSETTGFIDTVRAEYAVLEPSDIIRINDERFHMVDRKAAVGERVIVTSIDGPNATCGRYYKTGNIAKVIVSRVGSIFADLTQNDAYYGDGKWLVDHRDYRVLELLTSASYAETPPAPLSSRPATEQSAETIAALTSEVESLKKRVAALESLLSKGEQVGEVIRKILDKVDVKTPQQIRDEIVERAKADVTRICDIGRTDDEYLHESAYWDGRWFDVDFVVNRDKRSVTALVYELNGPRSAYQRINRRPDAVGRAVCAPTDVFNAHIGRAISLRRALGLAVPTEYLTVPSPTEVRVGDIVKDGLYQGPVYAIKPTERTFNGAGRGRKFFSGSNRGLTFITDVNGKPYEYWAHIHSVEIIDDSREDYVTTGEEVAA